MRILGLIPARAGSKGVPNKNKKALLGKPLMQYTIESAQSSELLNRIVFSSEDQELIRMANSMGIDTPFVRPLELATDSASSLSVIIHAINELANQGEHYDAVCLLQVTNPFRTSAFIDKAITKFMEGNFDALISVLEVPHEYNPHWVFKTNKQNQLKLATGDKEIIKRRQDLPKSYYRDGSIYITKTDVLLEQNSLYGNTIGFVIADKDLHVNIDTQEDWEKAEHIAKTLKK